MVKNPVVRFAVGDPAGAQSSIWRLWTGRKHSDVYLAARTVAQDVKISLHESGNWRHAFTSEHVSGPSPLVSPDQDRAVSKWQRPPEMAPGVTMAFQILVPSSEATVPKQLTGGNPPGSEKATVWVPRAPAGSITHFTVLFTSSRATAATLPCWPGRRSMGTKLVSRIGLPNGETVWVVAHEQRMSESQRATLAQRRVHISRLARAWGFSPGELRALYFGREDGTAFYMEVSDKGIPLASERW